MWDKSIKLVEHQCMLMPELSKPELSGLSQYLDTIWQTRALFYENDPEETVSMRQPFLDFGYEASKGQLTLKAGKYVGFIQYGDLTIQILPKLFKEEQTDLAFRHLIWWLDYSQRVRFPFADLLSGSETIENFPEALIRYFARFTYQQIATSPYHQYEEATEAMTFLRGRLNTQAYINTSLSRGNWHQLVCDHEPFQFNNRLNQIIKYVARRLSHLCRYPDTLRDLDQVLFLLDEVDDGPCTLQDCETVQLNRFFQEYEHCLDMCRFFLTDQYLNRQDDQQRHFCFLVPMDMVYEDFIAGVIKTHFGRQFIVRTQAPDWLTEQRKFRIWNDVLLTDPAGHHIVLDTKYKIRDHENNDRKAGISQTDLYQMLAYGLRRNSRQVVLLYPLSYGREAGPSQLFTINSDLMENQPIRVQAVDLTISGQVSTQQAFDQYVVEATLLPQLTEAFKLIEAL